jgi:hypothetical protein
VRCRASGCRCCCATTEALDLGVQGGFFMLSILSLAMIASLLAAHRRMREPL